MLTQTAQKDALILTTFDDDSQDIFVRLIRNHIHAVGTFPIYSTCAGNAAYIYTIKINFFKSCLLKRTKGKFFVSSIYFDLMT